MPRYFFHVEGPQPFVDRDGTELPDVDAAWSMATSSCAEILKDLDGLLPADSEISTRVTDESDSVMITLRFTGKRHDR